MNNLQLRESPKNLDCIHGIPQFYESITLEDILYIIDHCLELDPVCTSIGIAEKKPEED